ncbi:GFA family protein [Paracoccus sp. S-4012]|uniref:GFA family protein n=1 Tax=Paracoccus sp. S-4012 TaxID=2665648 RepID=UPI0012B04A23|nr:GFA family protein [Paracoccus sp. S-4012]MRX50957.1 GFA family protein [Paracoccus sp. S-4012]
MSHRVTGGCLCGAVRFRAVLADRSLRVCACTQCLRQNSGPWFDLPSVQGIEWQGAVATYRSSPGHLRGFCATCGSTLYWHREGQSPALSHGALDDRDGFALTDFEHQDTRPDAYRVVAATEGVA